MLRDFVYAPSPALIKDILDQFDISVPRKENGVVLIEFQLLTPDSFIWRLLIDKVVYYMYAEDYVEGLDDIRRKISSYAPSNIEFDFVKAKQQKKFDDAEPVNHAKLYNEPKDYDEMKQFSVGSGHDFVFLCKSNESSNNALFND